MHGPMNIKYLYRYLT